MAGEDDSRELRELEARVQRLEVELASLRKQLSGEDAGVARPEGAGTEVRSAAPPPPPPLAAAKAAADTGRARVAVERLRSEGWGRPAQAGTAAPRTASGQESLESRLGSQIFNRIAIVLLLIGTAYGLKLAVDRGWIGPVARVIVGVVAGAGLVLWSERFRRKGFAAFSYSLKAVGSGVLYLSLWAAFRLYGLLPAEAALGLMVLVTAWNAYMAWVQEAQLLAVYALAGGFATPMLLSTGGNHEVFLFTYLLAIDVATVVLVRLRGWPKLILGVLPLTVVYFIGWYSQFYRAEELAATSVFLLLFGVAFGSVPIGREQGIGNREQGAENAVRVRRGSVLLEDILLPLANAAFVALAGYSVLQDSGNHAWLPWLMVALAAVYLGVMRLPQTAVASAIHLSLAVVLLTIAVPLKASGAWITVSWLVEGLALVWVATRLGADEATGGYASRTLRWLGSASLALGFCGVCVHVMGWADAWDVPLWNKGTGTALVGIAIFAVAAWLALRAGSGGGPGAAWSRIAMGAVLLIAMTAVLLTARELVFSWETSRAHPAFATTDFATAVMALAVFAGVVWACAGVAKVRAGEEFWSGVAALGTIAFNLIAVLTGVREVSALWPATSTDVDAALQQALAISGFLMLYGAGLLAVGFWKRSEFLRWQALVLLLTTILKTFLYDMRNLSQGYRVASFLALGALLLAVSFAYQKDLLNLRGEKLADGSSGQGDSGVSASDDVREGAGEGEEPHGAAQ